jgi:hypothetical protein
MKKRKSRYQIGKDNAKKSPWRLAKIPPALPGINDVTMFLREKKKKI